MKTFGLFTLMTLAMTVAAGPQAWVRRQNDPQTSLCLDSGVIAQGLKTNGNRGAGQAPSLISSKNFIDFCAGREATAGKQNADFTCNPVPIGIIPSVDNTPSVKIIQPKNKETVDAFTDVPVRIAVKNLATGNAVNPEQSFLAAPQQLAGRIIRGHVLLTVDQLDSFDQTTPTDPSHPTHAEVITAAADENGQITTIISKGLPTGDYRMCAIASSMNYAPVVAAIARHGSHDDCVYFHAQPPA